MFCDKCGHELPDGTVFCTQCGAKNGQTQETVQAEELRTAEAAPQTDMEPVKKKKGRSKVKLIAVLTVIVLALAGIGTLAYNSQPFISRVFKGEQGHISQLMNSFTEKYEAQNSNPYKNVRAKITHDITYDLGYMKELLGSASADLDLAMTQVIEIDGKNEKYRMALDGDISGVELPSIAAVIASEDIGIFVENLTDEYISLNSLLKQMQTSQSNVQSSEALISLLTVLQEKADEIEAFIKDYQDAAIKVICDSDNVYYEANNDDLDFNAHYYEISVSYRTFAEAAEELLNKLREDQALQDLLYELVGSGQYIEGFPVAREMSRDEFCKQLVEQIDSILQDIDYVMQQSENAEMLDTEICRIELWFDGQNRPLGMAITVNQEDSEIVLKMLDYKRGGKNIFLITLDQDEKNMLEISSEYVFRGSNEKGSLSINIQNMLSMEFEYDITSFTKHQITLYEGSVDFSANVFMTSTYDYLKISAEVEMEKLSDGMKMTLAPSVKTQGVTVDVGELTSVIKVEALKEDIKADNFVELNSSNYQDYVNPDRFSRMMEEFVESIEEIIGQGSSPVIPGAEEIPDWQYGSGQTGTAQYDEWI